MHQDSFLSQKIKRNKKCLNFLYNQLRPLWTHDCGKPFVIVDFDDLRPNSRNTHDIVVSDLFLSIVALINTWDVAILAKDVSIAYIYPDVADDLPALGIGNIGDKTRLGAFVSCPDSPIVWVDYTVDVLLAFKQAYDAWACCWRNVDVV